MATPYYSAEDMSHVTTGDCNGTTWSIPGIYVLLYVANLNHCLLSLHTGSHRIGKGGGDNIHIYSEQLQDLHCHHDVSLAPSLLASIGMNEHRLFCQRETYVVRDV